ncbi:MAG: YwiC-like family protein [Cyanobacteria bacterium P01_A01_bin.17]
MVLVLDSPVPVLPVEAKSNSQAGFRPIFAPEQGSLLVLGGAIISGASLAQTWTSATTLVCLCTLFALQVEHPLVVLLKLKSWKARFVFWGGLYGAIALAIALWLSWSTPVLLWIFGAAIASLAIDLVAVTRKQHKSIANEITMFTAICLSTPLAYGATVGAIPPEAIGLWLLNSLFFATAVFTIKFRKGKADVWSGVTYLAVAVVVVASLYFLGWLKMLTALTFGIAILKFGVVVCFQDWYRTCWFGAIARFETYFALSYICLVALTVLPPHLPTH